jgi:hypothetical protein
MFKSKQMTGLLLVVVGVAMLCISYYIHTQVVEGQGQIRAGQEKVDMVKRPFSLSPASKPIGNVITGSAQSQIDEGRGKVAYYEMVAKYLQIGGVIAIILGIGLWLFGLFKKR